MKLRGPVMWFFAFCLALVWLFTEWLFPVGEWVLFPALLVVPWLWGRRLVRGQMDRELAALIAAQND